MYRERSFLLWEKRNVFTVTFIRNRKTGGQNDLRSSVRRRAGVGIVGKRLHTLTGAPAIGSPLTI